MKTPFELDEYFEGFLEDFGDSISQSPCSVETIIK